MEGLLIDIKTRLLPRLHTTMDVEKFRPKIEEFLDEAVALTPATLVYAPSQVNSFSLHPLISNGWMLVTP